MQNFVTKLHPDYVEDDNGKKEFFVSFVNMPAVLKLRDLRTDKIGTLSSFSATVTRTSEVRPRPPLLLHVRPARLLSLPCLQVRPELLFGGFNCMVCGSEVKDVEQQCRYTTPTICPNPTCNNRRGPGLLNLFSPAQGYLHEMQHQQRGEAM